LERSIKETGEKEIIIKLHHDVAATLKVEIKSFTAAHSVREESDASEAKSKAKRKTKPVA
jgi:hypothetical protein